ncbi:hypothetical protein [Streptomyces roseolilacinus]|uniref:Uncharacterized protein n=1 Tax=Streptomyces roseolilacinus TaxID=66904 RepID=A0A918B614_9ACTN|nr:hypothetical protein [Streptomyces roseolilacinus]GGQ33086.1 hypothetical protein GCM10010249_59570 [Streptomyces roseolilacinus]
MQGDLRGSLTVRPGLRNDVTGYADQNPGMVQNLVAVFSLLIGLAGLTLSYAAHRQKVRQDRQEAALREGELQRFQREREQEQRLREREQSAERQRERHQASMINVNVTRLLSPLGHIIPKAVIQNRSNQPVRDVRVSFRDEVVGELPLLGTGEDAFELDPTESDAYGYLQHITVDFTDVAGIRWRLEGRGYLRRARQGTGSPETLGSWGEPEPPVIQQVFAPPPPPGPVYSAPPAPAPRMGTGTKAPVWRRGEFLRPAVVLVSFVLIAGGVWRLLHHY